MTEDIPGNGVWTMRHEMGYLHAKEKPVNTFAPIATKGMLEQLNWHLT